VAEEKNRETAEAPLPLPLPALLALGWLLPGLGHFILGRRSRAVVFAVVILVAFATGLILDGELILPRHGDPLSYLAAIAIVGNGVLFFIAKYLGLGQGAVTAASYEFGNTFLLTAGMMNLLLLLDIHDIAVGRKDW
jgi:hypothetical protein